MHIIIRNILITLPRVDYIIIAMLSLSYVGCKKTTTITTNSNNFGTIIGDGNPHTIAEVMSTEDDHYLICGAVSRGEYGMSDGYLMKLDKNFNVVWERNYGGSNQDFFSSLAVGEDGNILLVGNSFSYGLSLDTSNPNRNNLIYMVQVNPSGIKLWEKTLRANDSAKVKNFSNSALKVVSLNNNTYCVGGASTDFSTNNTTDGFVFGISNIGDVLWSGNYLEKPVSTGRDDFEYIDDIEICPDGDLMLLFQSQDNSLGNQSGTLFKIPVNSTGHKENFSLWKSPRITNMAVNPWFQIRVKLQLEMLPQNKMAVAGGYNPNWDFKDTTIDQLLIIDQNGVILSNTKFKHFINELSLKRVGDKLVVSGYYRDVNLSKFPCWVITDLEGKIINEVYLNKDLVQPNRMEIKSTLINKQSEIVTFATLGEGLQSYINVLRFDQNGLLKK